MLQVLQAAAMSRANSAFMSFYTMEDSLTALWMWREVRAPASSAMLCFKHMVAALCKTMSLTSRGLLYAQVWERRKVWWKKDNEVNSLVQDNASHTPQRVTLTSGTCSVGNFACRMRTQV